MRFLLRALHRDETGTAILEYALVLSLISMVSYGVLVGIGAQLESFFNNSSKGLASGAEIPQ